MRRLLFIDNDTDFLETRAEFLERAGYKLVKATSLVAAEILLREVWTPVAILDIRLIDDDDEKDLSGMILAKSEQCRPITKIILTNFPSKIVSELLTIASADRPQTVDVLHKQDGPEALIAAVEKAFTYHVHINWDLTLDWKATNSFALVSRIELGLEGERLVNRAEELEDLLRRLFYQKERVRIDRVLWQRDGRVALAVFTFKGASMDSFVVVCGRNAAVVDEANRAQNVMPKTQGETSTTLADKAETTHFTANAYVLAKADLETIRSLGDVYRSGDKKLFTLAVETLFEKTLPAWQPGPPIPTERASEEFYRASLGLTTERISPQAFQARWKALVRHIPELKNVIRDREPIITLLQSVAPEQSTLTINSPGMLTGDNILVDAKGQAWFTDFANADNVPQFWNFVALESVVRFDWVVIALDQNFEQSQERYLNCLEKFEECLLDDSHFGRPDAQMVESASARQAVRFFIYPIRQRAKSEVGKEYRQYHLGIFFHAARRFADFDPTVTPTPNECARLAHALMAMSMVAAKVGQAEREVAAKGERGLRVDKDGVKRDGKRLSVRGQSYNLLSYLTEHSDPDHPCTQRDLVENVLQEKFNERDKHQISRLQTAIRRLREKIEYDPDAPHFLVTDSHGYHLVLQPPDE